MRFAERLKKTIYIAPIDRSSRPISYGKPKAYRVNVLPTTAYADVQTYGVGYHSILRVLCDNVYAEKISEMDAAFVNVKPPTKTDKLASVADYTVKTVKRSLDVTELKLEKRMLDEG